MRYSIKDIFKNITLLVSLSGFLSFVLVLLILEFDVSKEKIKILQEQKKVAKEIFDLNTKDIEASLIILNDKTTQLYKLTQKLKDIYNYDITGKYIFFTSNEYISDIKQLSTIIQKYNKNAKIYYIKYPKQSKQTLKHLHLHLDSLINVIISKDAIYNIQKYMLLKVLSIILFLLIMFSIFWYKKRLSRVYQDILYLYGIGTDNKKYDIFTQEIEAIVLKNRKKQSAQEQSDMIDPLTQINNPKGLHHEYSKKKNNIKDSYFTCIAIFDIDNLSKPNHNIAKNVAQSIIKKVAFNLSLAQQTNDIVGRIGYSQFVAIFSRASKEQIIKDLEAIRANISQINFIDTNKQIIKVTLSCGVTIKNDNSTLDEIIKQAKEILKVAKEKGGDTISQAKDMRI